MNSRIRQAQLEVHNKMNWIPIVFGTFKALVLGTGMFFAIKWHYDQGKKKSGQTRGALRAGGQLTAAFVLLLLALGLGTFLVTNMLGLDLTF